MGSLAARGGKRGHLSPLYFSSVPQFAPANNFFQVTVRKGKQIVNFYRRKHAVAQIMQINSDQ